MRSKLYTDTKPHIICMRVSDDEMKGMKELMKQTNLSASEVIRRGFNILAGRLSETAPFEQTEECATACNG